MKSAVIVILRLRDVNRKMNHPPGSWRSNPLTSARFLLRISSERTSDKYLKLHQFRVRLDWNTYCPEQGAPAGKQNQGKQGDSNAKDHIGSNNSDGDPRNSPRARFEGTQSLGLRVWRRRSQFERFFKRVFPVRSRRRGA